MLPMHTLVENYGQTPDKPKLTVEDALGEFPDECLAVAPERAGKLRISKELGTVMIAPADEKRLGLDHEYWHFEDMNGNWVQVSRTELIGAAMQWLEGKKLRPTLRTPDCMVNALPPAVPKMPKDSLRWALEEVSELLRRERKRVPPLRGVKVTAHSEKTGEALGYA